MSREETDEIYTSLNNNNKVLKVYPHVGHNIFTIANKSQWVRDVSAFLKTAN
ncbi:MAG TPA: hypothetical protein VIM75_20570 [Ohtaekwangia sp.]|uniref:hypothetical protein n=1 Tax=Ohtaekwangia sp. TaxID=2066019 RepID=UPI002F93360B